MWFAGGTYGNARCTMTSHWRRSRRSIRSRAARRTRPARHPQARSVEDWSRLQPARVPRPFIRPGHRTRGPRGTCDEQFLEEPGPDDLRRLRLHVPAQHDEADRIAIDKNSPIPRSGLPRSTQPPSRGGRREGRKATESPPRSAPPPRIRHGSAFPDPTVHQVVRRQWPPSREPPIDRHRMIR